VTRQGIGRAVLFGSAIGLALLGGGAVLAQSTVDAGAEGRVLRRSDGALYLYWNGLRYGIVPAPMSDAQIDAIPDAGLLVERLDSVFTLVGAPNAARATPLPAASAPAASVVPATNVSATGGASFGAAVAGLVGQTLRTCGLLGVPVDIVVQQADPTQGPDGALHVLVIANVTNVGTQVTQASLPIELRDNRNRLFQISSAGLNPDVTILARQYGINQLTQQELEPGLSQRQLWTFELPPDIQTLTLAPDPFARCDGMVVP
jgi:hypothetical protein